MASRPDLTPTIAADVEQACFCFAAQKAARAIGRRYDAALRPTGLSNWQFTLLLMLVRDAAPTIGALAQHLATDRTTVTANLKPLERRGLLAIEPDADDRRIRRIALTQAGRALLAEAYPLWEAAQAACAARLGPIDRDGFRAAVRALSAERSGEG
jgi:DNA-binding MarR family transcriptional regulator